MNKQAFSAIGEAVKTAAARIETPENQNVNAISIQINLSSSYVVKRLCQGAKLSFDIKNEQEANIVVKNFPAIEGIPEPLKAIADQSNAQIKIDTTIANMAENRVFLPKSESPRSN